ncbi:MAG: glycosyltransferase family 39 protein [Gemmatirosa sp.]|nr:glycosyltransferase family 39 protein [Gemmatirosa sp.]
MSADSLSVDPPADASVLPRLRPTPWQAAAGLAALHLLLAWLSYVPVPFEGGDNATYLSLARSLLAGTGYREVWDPVGRPHTLYPPVFPAILAAAIRLGLTTEPALKWVVVLCSAVAVAVAYLWARRVTTPGIALGMGVVLAVSPGVLDLTHWVLSDVPFWAFAMVALWAFAHRAGEDAPRGVGWLILGVGAVLLAHFTRSAGLPLVVATSAYLLLRRRWVDAGVLAAVLLPAMVAWSAYGRAAHASGYLDAFRFVDPYDHARGVLGAGDFVRRVGLNVASYVMDRVPALLFFDLVSGARIAGVAFVLLATAGWAMRLRRAGARAMRAIGVAELWVPLHVGLLLVWPAIWSGTRFLLPILPPLLVYAAESVAWIGARLEKRRAALVSAAVASGVLMAQPLVVQVRYGRGCSAASERDGRLACLIPAWQAYFQIAEAVRGRLPAGAVVLTRKPTIFYAESGYRSSLYPLSDDRDSLFAVADSVGAEWVLADDVSDLAPRYLYPVLVAHRDDFCLVSDLLRQGGFLLRIDRDHTKGTRERGRFQVRECPLDPRRVPPGLTPAGTPQGGVDSARAGGHGPGR